MNRRSILFILWTFQALVALAWLAALPSDAEHGLLFGFSASRLALLGVMLALAGLSATLAWRTRRAAFVPGQRLRDGLLLLALVVIFCAPALLLILQALGQSAAFVYTAYAQRLAPLACWLTLSALELCALLIHDEWQEVAASLTPFKRFFFFVFCFFLALGALAILVSITRIGLTPYTDGSWGSPATPLLEWQILLALAAGCAFMVGAGRKWLQRDRWIALGIYVFTCLLWLSQPVNPGFFATAPRAPNFEIYPFSDALIYAQYAQSALAGNGFLWPDVPTRPLYITLLTWLHALAGQDYTHVIALQTLVLAAFPVVLYFLGKEIGGRPLGVGLALLAAFRDLTANVSAPFALNYTYSKLFFSEMPAALLLSLFALLALRWLRRSRSSDFSRFSATAQSRDLGGEVATTKWDWYPLFAGGILALAALIRLQSVVLLFAVIPTGFFIMRARKRWAAGSALMLLGTTLALLPWLARNYAATGGLVLDNPTSQAMVLARRWGGDSGNALIPYLPGESAAQYSGRMTQLALASLRQDPARILGSGLNHFANNEIGNLLVFPLRDRLEAPAELLWPAHAFWQTWNGRPGAGQAALIALYLALFGLGLATAWHKNGPVGLLPLGITLVYNAWTALFLSSGDRFLVPVDWAVYLYHFLGLLALAGLLLSALKAPRANIAAWLSAEDNTNNPVPPMRTSWRRLLGAATLVLCLGATVPLTELAFPKLPTVQARAAAPGETLLYGRAIYPRYYAAGEGEPGTAKLGYGAAPEARLVFYLVGPQNTLVIFPLDKAPAFFPNSANVAVFGTQQDGFVRAGKIIVEKDGKKVEYVP